MPPIRIDDIPEHRDSIAIHGTSLQRGAGRGIGDQWLVVIIAVYQRG